MKVTIIHGQAHKGSTYHISEMIKNKLIDNESVVDEYFMPKDAPQYCVGCYNCMNKGEEFCPHEKEVQLIAKSMENADVIIVDSPTYCFEMTGQLKTLFDHLAYMWMPHRPRKNMFEKVAIVISTAAGSGANKVTKSLKQQLFWMGVPIIYQLNQNVNAASWERVPSKIRIVLDKKIEDIVKKTIRKISKSKPPIKLKVVFHIMGMMQKSNNGNMIDKNYWMRNGWLNGKYPW